VIEALKVSVCGKFGKEDKMLEAIKEIGEYILKTEKRDLLETLVEEINPKSTFSQTLPKGRYHNAAVIVLNKSDGIYIFQSVVLEEYFESKKMQYLYRKLSGHGPDFSPTAKVPNRSELEKTFTMKILRWFKILENKNNNVLCDEQLFLKNIKKALEENKTQIVQEISEKINDIPKKEGIFITLKFSNGDDEEYIGDFKIFKDLFLETYKKKTYKNAQENKVCSICGEVKPIVLSGSNVYAFYTTDKPGFITGGFQEKNTWKNFPICPDCNLALEEGRNYIDKNLIFSFAGIRYQLIPKLLVGSEEVEDEVYNILINTEKLNSLKNDQRKKILSDEHEIFDYLKDEKDFMTLNFLFLKKSNAAERILLLIEDVFPSRIKRIFDAKAYVDGIFENGNGNPFTFRTIRNFFSKSDEGKRKPDLDTYFLDTVDRIFKDRQVDRDFILKFLMRAIRHSFLYDEYFLFKVRDGLQIISFLNNLDLIKMEVRLVEEREFDQVFKKYGNTFETPVKKGLFLSGTLCELLLRKQYKERGAKPFSKNLKSLKMTEDDFRALLPKIQNKLEEYDSFDKGKRLIATEVANYMLEAGNEWHMSIDEMNFYFSCGMNLVDEITKIIYKVKKEEEDAK